MVDNKIYEDLAARCGGDVCIAVKGADALAEKIEGVFGGNKKVRFTDKPQEASFGIVVASSEADCGAVNEFKTQNKPCIIVLTGGEARKEDIGQKFGVAVVEAKEINAKLASDALRTALFEFPVTSFDVIIPEWMRYLSPDCSALCELIERVRQTAPSICKMKDCSAFDGAFSDCKFWLGEPSVGMDLASGRATVTVTAKDGIFFDMLSEISGDSIADECSLMRYVRAASEAKQSYDKIKDAFECAKINGYGIVQPDDGDMSLDKPQIVRQGGSVGIKLKATAPSYHIVKIDVSGEVSPIMGGAKQSESIVEGMMNGFETNPDGMWETNVFGKSLRGMVKEGLSGKVSGMHDETKTKMRRAITRIVNEGKGGVICILL